MTDLAIEVANLPEREQTLILRSVAHVADESRLPEQMRLCNRITDLDVARLIHGIERGAIVVQRDAVWVDRGGLMRRRMPHLTRIVNECLRLGLVDRVSQEISPDVWRVWLSAAPVHQQAPGGGPVCPVAGERRTRRLRLSDDPGLVDCPACLEADRQAILVP
jgi:hypothetical protein